jgi:arylsulfatase A-like enzyme
MVGTYIDAIETAGLTDSTIFILSSDHGDMQMQHQQFYKMVAYEGSSHVPLVVAPGKDFASLAFRGRVRHLTSHVDMMPTFLELAGEPRRSYVFASGAASFRFFFFFSRLLKSRRLLRDPRACLTFAMRARAQHTMCAHLHVHCDE